MHPTVIGVWKMSTEVAPTQRKTYPNRAELGKAVGRYLKLKFHATGMTRKEAAEKAEVTEGYLTSLLAGRAVAPSPVIVRNMAGNWGFSIIEFYKVTGLIAEEDVLEYVAAKGLSESATDTLKVIQSLTALPSEKRKKAAELILSLLDTLAS